MTLAASHDAIRAADEWLTLERAAARLGITRTALYRWLQRGRVPHHRFGRLIRIHRDDFQKFVAERRFDRRWEPYDGVPTA